ncbi:outer membrane protein transport protein [Vibrio hannami]|uniref:outer membrane protein transport protein n=1 Tax=Vibrio hannami TaxID=2717094 RepID=UPI00240F3A4A|nr:outer membrane protein transport protein [Vibrio hannami]MDG3088741.1 outer membrane protein transport protein [Vibrio hannami]
MKINKSILATSIACSLLTVSTHSNAAGFQLAEYSATGLGRAYAGEAAMADNAGAQWRNPAMLTYLEGTQVSVGAVYVDPNVDIEGTETIPGVGSIATSSSDYAEDGLIPNAYISHRYNDKFAIGLAIGTNYAMETNLGVNFESSHHGDQAQITTSEVNLNTAYQVTSAISAGFGVRYVMAEGKIGSSFPNYAAAVNPNYTGTMAFVEGDTTDWGWQAGVAWQINDDNRVGFAYKSAVDLKLEGNATVYVNQLNTTVSSGGYLPLTLPATAELASYHQLSDRLAVHGSINWTDWSSFKKLQAEVDAIGSVLIKEENWDDNYRFAIGTTYQLNKKLRLRSGIAYDMEAVTDETRSITIPDTNRTWLSVGAGYDWSEKLTLDTGVTYIIGKKASVTEESTLGTFEGTTSSHVWIFGAQASYKF